MFVFNNRETGMKLLHFLTTVLALFSCGRAEYTNLDADAFEKQIRQEGVVLVDVRTAEEFAAGHLPGAANVDWYSDDFLTQVQHKWPVDIPLAIYCRSGKRSAAAAATLAKAGFTVYNLLGGYNGWRESGKPVSKD